LISFDANVLVYAADRDGGLRHDRAVDLIERAIRIGNCIQTLQSLCEFFNVATRKIGVDPQVAAAFVDGWHATLPVETPVALDLTDAMRAVREHRLSFWDAMLWATVRRAGVRLLITEDFEDGRILEGVRFVNPFAAHNDALIEREIPR
jgi:predicted nucleic acid-binding protein